MKAHEDSYTFDTCLAYVGFFVHVMSKFVDWRRLLVLIWGTPDLWDFNSAWREGRCFLLEYGKFSIDKQAFLRGIAKVKTPHSALKFDATLSADPSLWAK